MNIEEQRGYSSKHYDFHFIAGSTAEKDILNIANIQEICFKEICDFLCVSPTFKIQYFLLETPEFVGKIYGDNEPCNGFANLPDIVYAVYNEEVKCIGYHEDTHILSNLLNWPNSLFLREGLAMYFDKTWWGVPNEEWVKLFIHKDNYLPITKLINNNYFKENSDEITYPISGAFTKYLIERHGRDLYISLYEDKGDDLLTKFEQVYLMKLEYVERDFLDYLSNYNLKG